MKNLTCQEVLDQLADYLDDAAHAELVGAVERHIGACAHCRVEVDTLKLTIQFYRPDERIHLSPPVAAKLQLALDEAYRDRRGPDEGIGEA